MYKTLLLVGYPSPYRPTEGTRLTGCVMCSSAIQAPVFSSIHEACQHEKPEAILISSPSFKATDDILEAVKEEIPMIVVSTEKLKLHEIVKIKNKMAKSSSFLIGPASSGFFKKGIGNIGLLGSDTYEKGDIIICSKSTSLFYEAAEQLKKHHIGLSGAVVTGASAITGTSLSKAFEQVVCRSDAKAVLIIGEIGLNEEKEIASSCQKTNKKIFAYIAGQNMPAEIGNLSAFIRSDENKVPYKKEILKKVGVILIDYPSEIGRIVAEQM